MAKITEYNIKISTGLYGWLAIAMVIFFAALLIGVSSEESSYAYCLLILPVMCFGVCMVFFDGWSYRLKNQEIETYLLGFKLRTISWSEVQSVMPLKGGKSNLGYLITLHDDIAVSNESKHITFEYLCLHQKGFIKSVLKGKNIFLRNFTQAEKNVTLIELVVKHNIQLLK